SQSFARLPAVHALSELPDLLPDTDLLVNTTALGMTGKPPLELDLSRLKTGVTVCDIVYAPLETDLLRQARLRGNRAVGGLGMLMHQAVPGFARWFGRTPAVTPALRAALEADLAR
ncbi:MAG: shikimate dehydrogenase, partial [Gluconacetobacter diazotrophicus]|nr:shikimate dehydrogenase [Gluconacetobacter diazotrophicus]